MPDSFNRYNTRIATYADKKYAWEKYEAIQADIFDHILAVLPEFELRIFQNPAGADFSRLVSRE